MIRTYAPTKRWKFFYRELFEDVLPVILLRSDLLDHLLPQGMDQSTREPEDEMQSNLESIPPDLPTIAFFSFVEEMKLLFFIHR
jgi:hypothetical protein